MRGRGCRRFDRKVEKVRAYITREDAFKVLTEYYHHKTPEQDAALLEALSRVPTEDVRPVVHGKWVLSIWHGRRICSVCKSETDESGYYNHYQFCPRCGADMREVDNG